MDPAEIIKAAPEIATGLTAVGAAIPLTAVVRRMLGPAADELAEMWRDQIRLYRYGRQLKCIEKAEKMAKDAGFTPKAVPPKILFPLLEGASMEEDEDLHTMWAALLANASSDMGHIVRPSFIALLRELAPDEAGLLNAISAVPYKFEAALLEAIEFVPNQGGRREAIHAAAVYMVDEVNGRIESDLRRMLPEIVGEDADAREQRYQTCFQMLKVEGLIEAPIGRYNGPCRPSSRGKAFLEACSPPKPKS